MTIASSSKKIQIIAIWHFIIVVWLCTYCMYTKKRNNNEKSKKINAGSYDFNGSASSNCL